jgi:putative endonuclease
VRHWAEEVARRHLEGRGYVALAENAVVRGGELDLVMRDGRTVVAVEVRQRAHDRYGGAAESLRPAKLRRLRRALARWAAAEGAGAVPLRVDAVLIDGPRGAFRIEHLRNVA